MRDFGPGRLVAPLALLVVVIAIFLILRPDGGGEEAATPATSTTTTRSTSTTARRATQRKRTYTVRANDTLSAIAARTGVSLERIQSLNPDADAGALREGQKLKLTG